MTIMVQETWTQIGNFSDGTPARAVGVYDDKRLVGRVVDMCDGNYRIDFINGEGEFIELTLPNYYSAVMRLAEEARLRKRKLH